LQEIIHAFVVTLFGLNGISFWLSGVLSALHVKSLTGLYFEAEFDFLAGIACFLAAVGLYRFDERARRFAILLTALFFLVAAVALFAGASKLSAIWLTSSLSVLSWLLSDSVRHQFISAKEHSQVS